jgi:hypothetical protein
VAERVRFELTSPVKGLRFSSLMTYTQVLRTRTQSPLFPMVPAGLEVASASPQSVKGRFETLSIARKTTGLMSNAHAASRVGR